MLKRKRILERKILDAKYKQVLARRNIRNFMMFGVYHMNDSACSILNVKRRQLLARVKIQKVMDQQNETIPPLFNIHY